jgi:predicted DNA-binding transcriptional regulator AlpA
MAERTCSTRLIRGAEVDHLRGHARTKRYADIAAGLLPPPVVRGPRDSRYPLSEIEAVVAAEIAGASVEERRALVRRLVAARSS